MLTAKGAGVAHRVSGADARRNDQLGGKVGLLATTKTKPPQVTGFIAHCVNPSSPLGAAPDIVAGKS
jgi:hypothetical protein